MGKNPSLVKQVVDALMAKMEPGRSKHADKQSDADVDVIYSYQTLRSYIRQCVYMAKWARDEYGCRTLEEVKLHVSEYLTVRVNQGLSPFTLHLDTAAVSKLYGCSMRSWGVDLPLRKRSGITRSRRACLHDREFSEKANQDVVDFCRGSGPRESELIPLSPNDVAADGSTVTILRGKGNKFRVIPVLPQYQEHVAAMRQRAIDLGRKKVFLREEIKNRMDVHSYRREYAQALYAHYESTNQHMSHTMYCCRGDLAGVHYDRGIMKAVSEALGHSRINVIAQSYLT